MRTITGAMLEFAYLFLVWASLMEAGHFWGASRKLEDTGTRNGVLPFSLAL